MTVQEPSKRFRNGKGYYKQPYFYRAILKYGWDGFEHIIIQDGLSKEEAEKLEIELIKEYKTNIKQFGYNIENGGNCVGKVSDETRKKISVSHIGHNNPFYGRKHSKETKLILSKYSKGRKMSEESKILLSKVRTGVKVPRDIVYKSIKNRRNYVGENNPNYGNKRTEEYKIDNMMKQPNRKQVLQIDIETNNILNSYNSIREASKITNIDNSSIGRVCNGISKTAGGYTWKYNYID